MPVFGGKPVSLLSTVSSRSLSSPFSTASSGLSNSHPLLFSLDSIPPDLLYPYVPRPHRELEPGHPRPSVIVQDFVRWADVVAQCIENHIRRVSRHIYHVSTFSKARNGLSHPLAQYPTRAPRHVGSIRCVDSLPKSNIIHSCFLHHSLVTNFVFR